VPEADLEIMRMLLECIVLLCQRRGLREELRKRKVYNVVKNLDTKVEDDRVSELIYEIVNLLMGDEDHSNPLDTYAVKLPLEPGTATAAEPAVVSGDEPAAAEVDKPVSSESEASEPVVSSGEQPVV
jgi:hypothetical protein